MNQITRIGIDSAKNIFHLCGTDHRGHVHLRKVIKRAQLTTFLAQQPACEIILEACASAHHWSRVITNLGHQVKLIHPAYVRPYVKTNKNDMADAQALCEAASRPTMRFVQSKTIEQQDIQLLHRIRERLVGQRTALSNQIRGMLAEYGIVLPIGMATLRQQFPLILEDAENELTHITRAAFCDLYQEFVDINERVNQMKQRIESMSKSITTCKQLMTIPGVGPMVSTAVYMVMGCPQHYKNGREFSAFLGLVPKQYSTGGKSVLKGISKRGDPMVRALFVQGAHSVLQHAHKKQDGLNQWVSRLRNRKPASVTVVAIANKLARMCWAVSATRSDYRGI